MIGAYELVVLSPAFMLVAVAVSLVTATGCLARRDVARERHHQRREARRRDPR